MPAFLLPFLASAFGGVMTWIFRAVVVRVFFLIAMHIWVAEVCSYLLKKLPDYATPITQFFAQIPPGIWWALDLFSFSYGFPLMLSAYVMAFCIRRIPFFN